MAYLKWAVYVHVQAVLVLNSVLYLLLTLNRRVVSEGWFSAHIPGTLWFLLPSPLPTQGDVQRLNMRFQHLSWWGCWNRLTARVIVGEFSYTFSPLDRWSWTCFWLILLPLMAVHSPSLSQLSARSTLATASSKGFAADFWDLQTVLIKEMAFRPKDSA